MTREEVMKLIPSVTEEQVTAILNGFNGEMAKTKDQVASLKTELGKAKELEKTNEELQKKLEELEAANLSDQERLEKERAKEKEALDKANAELQKKVEELEKTMAISSTRQTAVEKLHITAEEATKVVKDDGSFDMEVLGEIISNKEKSAVADYEKQKLAQTPNPNGGTGDPADPNAAVNEVAKAAAERAKSASADVLKHYIH